MPPAADAEVFIGTRNYLDYTADRFKISIHMSRDEDFERKLKLLPTKESVDESTWLADLKDYQAVLQTFADYELSPALKTAVEKVERSGGTSIIPDVVLSRRDGKIKVVMPSYHSDLVERLQAVPKKKFDTTENCWLYPSDRLRNVLEALQGFKVYTLKDIRDEARQIVHDLSETRRRREANEALLRAEEVELDYEFRIPPFHHQRLGIKFLIDNLQAGLFDEQGLGKSEQLICALDLLQRRGAIARAVIVCPNSVKYPWGDEISKHCALSYRIVEGDRRRRAAALASEAFFLVLNYELLRIEFTALERLFASCKCALVFDESQKIKNRNTKTTKAAQKLALQTEVRYLATGTPVGNRPEDLWAQIQVLDGGRLFGKYHDFLQDYCQLGNKYSTWAIVRYKNLNQLRDKLRSISIRRLKNQVLDLPEKLYQLHHVDLCEAQAAMYRQMRDTLAVTIRDLTEREVEQKAQNIMVQMVRLSQIASNPRLLDKHYQDGNAKLEELDSLLEDLLYDDKKVIIWTSYVDNVLELCSRYERYQPRAIFGQVSPEERFRIVADFQSDPAIKILIGTPKSAREGLTLTRADTAIYFDRTFNAVDYWQSQDRIHRIGQAGSCTIINLVARDTIEEYIDQVLAMKREYAINSLGDDEEACFTSLKLNRTLLLELLRSST